MPVTLLQKWMLVPVVARDLRIQAAGVEVLACLLHHYNNKTTQCNPSYATVAAWTGLNRDTVIKSVAALEAAGYLRIVRALEKGEQASKGQRLPSNSFEFDFTKADQSEKTTTPSRKSRPSQSKIPTTPVGNSDQPQSLKPATGSRKSRPKDGKLENGNIETGNGSLFPTPAPAGDVQRKRHRVDLPDDWVFSSQQWMFAAQLGLTESQIEEEQRKLKNYVRSNAKRLVEWDPWIEDWIRRAVEWKVSRGKVTSQSDLAGFDDFRDGGRHG